MATGLGDAAGAAEARLMLGGASVAPPSPAHLRWARTPDGGGVVRWTRRSRAGWRWIDGVDAPLAEESELYGVAVTHGDGSLHIGETDSTEWPLAAAALAEGPVSVSVTQRGTHRNSTPATISISGWRA